MIIRRDELTCYGPLLAQRHGVVSEYPVVAGTGISVHRLGIMHHFHGYSAEELVEEYMGAVRLDGIRAALDCFKANQELFDRRIKEEDAETERLANLHYAQTHA